MSVKRPSHHRHAQASFPGYAEDCHWSHGGYRERGNGGINLKNFP